MPNTPTRARARVGANPAPVPVSGEEASVTVMFDSEVELVDVALVERRQRAEHDLAFVPDRVLAEPSGLDLLPLLAADSPGHERSASLAREVADVLGDPVRE